MTPTPCDPAHAATPHRPVDQEVCVAGSPGPRRKLLDQRGRWGWGRWGGGGGVGEVGWGGVGWVMGRKGGGWGG
ncbi:hypothetical protein E0H26_15965 [Micromonospora zingiberis]|uniref:Uncharacterized protein n=1 Tax=Micromonospora zingiberis TaxID=2053011 RepID=A0A4R0GMA6_9ACTN|nr:hypothetical protein E0H26_15965 [Micromonospora zingiberis]